MAEQAAEQLRYAHPEVARGVGKRLGDHALGANAKGAEYPSRTSTRAMPASDPASRGSGTGWACSTWSAARPAIAAGSRPDRSRSPDRNTWRIDPCDTEASKARTRSGLTSYRDA